MAQGTLNCSQLDMIGKGKKLTLEARESADTSPYHIDFNLRNVFEQATKRIDDGAIHSTFH